ncbi:MAG: polysaccharide biosynthesis protein [Clostridia bacterium]
MTESKNKIAKSGVLMLAISGLIAKVIGAVYRIPLTNILGAEGIGVYQLVFPLFALVLALSTSYIPIGLSRLVAYHNAKGEVEKVNGALKGALLFTLLTSVVCVAVVLALATPLSLAQKNSSLVWCYYAIVPTILFVALSNVCKGWFFGVSNMLPNSITQMLEQIVKLAVGLSLAKALVSRGIIYGVVGALAGLAAAEFVSLVVVAIWFFLSRAKSKEKSPKFNYPLFSVAKTFSPIMLSGLIFPIVGFVDSLLILRLLGWFGLGPNVATAQYGLLSGPIGSLVNLPVVISISLAMAIVPAVSSGIANFDVVSIKRKTASSIKISYLVCVPCFLGMFLLANPIISLLYPSLSAEETLLSQNILRLLSINVVFLSQLEILNAMLQGLNKSKEVFLILAVSAVVKIVVSIATVPFLGIYGACISSIVFYLVAFVTDIIYYNYLVGKNKKLLENISKILCCGVIMSVAVGGSIWFVSNNILAIFVGIFVGVAIYSLSIVTLKALDKDELASLPLVGKWFAKKLSTKTLDKTN